ncbi:MAG: c-type cytochrome biogenesis protein CcmI [Pseudomonadota bacterium]
MTVFLLVCLSLIILSGVFFLFPRSDTKDQENDEVRANLQWFRRRAQELDSDADAALLEDAKLRLLEDEADYQAPGVSRKSRFPVWVLLPVVALLAGSLYYVLGSAPDVMIARQLQTLSDAPGADIDMQRLISAIERRAQQRPDNLHYKAFMGRYYMGQENYNAAARTYRELLAAVPEDAQALAYSAQADYLAAGRQLTDDARLKAEQALAADPHQRTALGLLGMASFEQGSYRAAIAYWQRLLAMEPPGSQGAATITGVIDRARQQLGEAGDVPAALVSQTNASATPPAPGGKGVTVFVTLPETAGVADSDTVFVLARNPAPGSRMPIAVRRFSGRDLPATVRLDDSHSMAGQKISDASQVVVVAQVSPDGRPGAATASWLGETGTLTPSADSVVVDLVLQPAGHEGAAMPSDRDATATAAVSAPEEAGKGVTVMVSLPENGEVADADTVFVLARSAAAGSRMPIAVRRLTGRELPAKVRLDDSHSMAGQKISNASEVVVVAQVSPDGRPGAATASWLGEAGPLTPSDDGPVVNLQLQPN